MLRFLENQLLRQTVLRLSVKVYNNAAVVVQTITIYILVKINKKRNKWQK